MDSVTKPPGMSTTLEGSLTDTFGDLVPLLTVFTPPEGCVNSWVYDTRTEGTVWKDRHYNTDYPFSCMPFHGQTTVYRPGVCPSGQEFKRIDVTVEGGVENPQTWYMGNCCSTGYKISFREGVSAYMECFSGLVPPVVATFTAPAFRDADTIATSTTTISSAVVATEEAVNIIWNESDLTYFPAPVAQSFRALMGLPRPRRRHPRGISADSSSVPTTNSLSGGAIAGISVGVVIFVALQALLCYLSCGRYRRKKKKKKEPHQQYAAQTLESPSSRSGGHGQSSWLRPWRKDEAWPGPHNTGEQNNGPGSRGTYEGGGWMAELQDTHVRRGELPGAAVESRAHQPAELEGGTGA
ncbi:hypothetical protein AAE478_010128 [Parahypoxylon ruwenzoriense]